MGIVNEPSSLVVSCQLFTFSSNSIENLYIQLQVPTPFPCFGQLLIPLQGEIIWNVEDRVFQRVLYVEVPFPMGGR